MEPKEKTADGKTVSNPEYERLFDEIIQLTHGAKFLLEVNKQAQETAQLREALKELIEIAEEYITIEEVRARNVYPYYLSEYQKVKTSIENARKLTNQPNDSTQNHSGSGSNE